MDGKLTWVGGGDDGSGGFVWKGLVFLLLGVDDLLQVAVPPAHRVGDDALKKDLVVDDLPQSVFHVDIRGCQHQLQLFDSFAETNPLLRLGRT